MKLIKSKAVWLILLAEFFAFVGALPWFDSYLGGFRQWSLWEENNSILIGFMLTVVGATIFYTRRENYKVIISALLMIIGLLLVTIFLTQTFIGAI